MSGEDGAGTADALVVFGATGDLARKKIFPALYAMVKRGTLTVPVIGVACSSYDLQDLHARRAFGQVSEPRMLSAPSH